MGAWDVYPANYRHLEVQAILSAVQGGECVSVVGLSGSGKSNLLGFIARRLGLGNEPGSPYPFFVLVDLNLLVESHLPAFFQLIRQSIASAVNHSGHKLPGQFQPADQQLALETDISNLLSQVPGLCLLFDRFDIFVKQESPTLFSNLRALRDKHKYGLTFVTAARNPLPADNELVELFYANILWLGPLNESDSRWTVEQYMLRKSLRWNQATIQQLVTVSGKYPSLLRAVCEAHASGTALEENQLSSHPLVQRRLTEILADHPTELDLEHSGLAGNPLLAQMPAFHSSAKPFDTTGMTAKEYLLLEYFRSHPNIVCDKDTLIQAVWPEDKIFTQGVRDDSLAQLVRRLRLKIEPDASNPSYIQTIPGRGYLFKPG